MVVNSIPKAKTKLKSQKTYRKRTVFKNKTY